MFSEPGDETWIDKVPAPLWPLADPGADPMVLVWRPNETAIDKSTPMEEVTKSIVAKVSH